MSQLKVLFFARLREQLACEQQVMELADGEALSRQQLISRLAAVLGEQAAELLSQSNVLFAVNQRLQRSPEATVVAGDEVAFFPPVTGG